MKKIITLISIISLVFAFGTVVSAKTIEKPQPDYVITVGDNVPPIIQFKPYHFIDDEGTLFLISSSGKFLYKITDTTLSVYLDNVYGGKLVYETHDFSITHHVSAPIKEDLL